MRRLGLLAVVGVLVPATVAAASTSHAGWPRVDGMQLMNKTDRNRPLDGRPGADPFGRTDPTYSCDSVHRNSLCVGSDHKVSSTPHHNELLGGHGDDTIHAGPIGDVLWGDYKPSGQPTSQVDVIHGGAGKDFIYAGHGKNTITTGGGADQVHAHYGHGSITCSSAKATVFLSHRSRKHYKLKGCPRISYKTVGH